MVATTLEQMYENDIAQAAQQLGKQEQINLQMARAAFQELNPMPPPWVEPVFESGKWLEPIYVEPTFMKTMGVQATAMTASVIGSILISAFTVGLVLYISAVNTDVRLIEQTNSAFLNTVSQFIPALFFIGGLVAVEGYAFSHEYAVGKLQGAVDFSNYPLYAAYAIMITTGLLRSLGIIDSGFLVRYPLINTLSQLGVVLSVTIGVPILIGYGARNLGVFRNQFDEFKRTSAKTFQTDRDEARKKWEKEEDDRRIAFEDRRNLAMEAHQTKIKDWFDAFRKYWEKNYSGQVLGIDRAAPTRVRSNGKTPSPTTPTTVIDAIRQYLRSQSIYPSQVGAGLTLAPSAVCDALNLDERARSNISLRISRLQDEELKAKANGLDWLTI